MPKITTKTGHAFYVDVEDLPLVEAHKWNAARMTTGGHYITGFVEGRYVYLHRLIMNAAPGEIIDHANRDTLDNRRSNLRKATASQSLANRRGWSASGFRGVRQQKKHWRARITIDGKVQHLGCFAEPTAAAAAYDRAALAAFGSFATLNFPPTPPP